MTRNIKTFCLGLTALFAGGTIAVSVAQATETPEFTAGLNTVSSVQKINVSGSSAATQTLDVFGATINCTNYQFTGTNTVPSSTIEAHPTYTGCTGYGAFPVTVSTSNCNYLFRVEKTGSGGDYAGSVDLKCSGAGLEASVYLTGKDEGTPSCIVKIPAQSLLKTVTFSTDTTTGKPDDVTVSGTISGITATQTRNSFLCPVATSTTEAKQTISTPVTTVATSDNGLGTAFDIWID